MKTITNGPNTHIWLSLLYVLLATGMLYFFNSAILWPLKMMVVFYHESAHAISTWLTGGSVIELMMSPMQGGHVVSQGGSRAITLTSGYLGSLIIGISIFIIANLTKLDKWIMGFLGIWAIGIATFIYADTYTLMFGLSLGIIMLGIAYYLPQQINDAALKVFGLMSMIYVPQDIYSDTIERSHLKSDAHMFAQEIGGDTATWGTIWLVISLFFILFSLFINYKAHSRKNRVATLKASNDAELLQKTVTIRD